MPIIIDVNENQEKHYCPEVDTVRKVLEGIKLGNGDDNSQSDAMGGGCGQNDVGECGQKPDSPRDKTGGGVARQRQNLLRGQRQRGPRRRGREVKPAAEETPKVVPMKNAVMMLNEMFPPPSAPQYRVTSMSGPPNNPTFSIICCLQDQSHTGTGRSKKEAKLAASELALKVMFGMDFSGTGKSEKSLNTSNPRSLSDIDSWMELEGKNPVSILNELYPGVIFQLVSAEGPSHAPQFCVRASLADISYEGRGISKKEAKLHASKALLVHIHRVGFDPMTGKMKTGGPQDLEVDREGHSWADHVGGLVRNKFSALFDGTTYSRRKVMAGVVVDVEGTSSVVCVSSGTKCINGEKLCLGGSTLNDCHAEVVARRCLILWLYGQLEAVIKGDHSTVLRPLPEGGFCLKRGVTFHLFISTAPCGDARIFSLHEEPLSGSNCLTRPAGRTGEGNRGKLRSKIESGMGTVPLPEEGKLQTWDGVIPGERLLTMACSDKILRWNVVGVQGSLLTHWLTPVYLSTITVGSKFHPDHMMRALNQRAGCLDLPRLYQVKQPPLLATTSPEARQANKAQEYSLNWLAGGSPEVVLGSTGRTITESVSRLSKRSLADQFLAVAGLQGAKPRQSLAGQMQGLERMRYNDLKQLARDFQIAKEQLVSRLADSGAGRWVEKPVEQDQFYM